MLEFKFPDVGEGIHEGTIVKWRVKEGDEIKTDQVLVEIETDKAIVEIPSPRGGIIAKTFHKEHEIIKVGEPLVVITDKGETFDPAKFAAAATATTTASAAPAEKGPGVVGSIDASNTEIPAFKSTAQATTTKTIKILPATRILATKLGIDITKLTGTGANGAITDADILVAKNLAAPPTSPTLTNTPAPKTFSGPVTRIPYKGIRKTIGDHMAESHAKTVPTTHVDTIDVTKLFQKREQEKTAAAQQNIKLTLLAYITKAIIETLKEFPIVNAELDETTQEIIEKKYYNIGIAVDTDEGLFVPNIKNADQKDLYAIAQEITELANHARDKHLTPQDMHGGTFTITNYGSIGGDFATPVINYPEAAILGIGKMKDTLALDSANPSAPPHPTKTITFSLTFDHRIIDGATAARFMNALGQKLQS